MVPVRNDMSSPLPLHVVVHIMGPRLQHEVQRIHWLARRRFMDTPLDPSTPAVFFGDYTKRLNISCTLRKKISDKLRYLGIKSSTYIGLIPVVLNLYLIVSVSLEFIDFVPWFLLIDAHSLWHACTILPPIIWHDWNIWELELASQDFRLP